MSRGIRSIENILAGPQIPPVTIFKPDGNMDKYITDIITWLSTMSVTVGKTERAVSDFIGPNTEDFDFVEATRSMHNQDTQGIREIFVNDENGSPQKHRVASQQAIFSKQRPGSTLKSQGSLCAKLATHEGAKNISGFHWIAHPKHIPMAQWLTMRKLLFQHDENHLGRGPLRHDCDGRYRREH
jgi:hypothetical protein